MVGTAIPTLQKRITYKFQTHCNLVVKYPPPHVIESCITSEREREREREIMSPTELELDNEGLGLLQEI
jgi:hypothetical protein